MAKSYHHSSLLFFFAGLLLAAGDPDMLQDVCVGDLASPLKESGFACKRRYSADDFHFRGLAAAGVTNNTMGSSVTPANVVRVPGLNTLGVSLARVDYAPGGVNPPHTHTHPRATEVVFVLHGRLDVRFVTTGGRLVAKTIEKGDVFVFPRGLLHFQSNRGSVPAAVVAAFDSQLQGTQAAADALFDAEPAVPDDVLGKAFQVGARQVRMMRARLATKT